jgi:ADP-ribosylglycohydrolase
MRIAPLAFLLDPSKSVDRTIIRDVCRITHHNDEAYAGALAVVSALRSVLVGDWSQQHTFLRAAGNALPNSAVRDRIEELTQLEISSSEVASRFGASGHVVASVPLALHCAQYITEEPLSAVLARAISLGGDTDTIASIAGQLAGAVVATTGMPNDLFDGVNNREEIFQTFGRFAKFIAQQGKQNSISFNP